MYAEILLPVKLGKNQGRLTYSVPAESSLKTGQAVRVPLRNKTHTGIVAKMHNHSIKFTAKEILSVQEGGRVLEPWQIELAEWMADHYFAPLYKVLKLMLPQKLWQKNARVPYAITYQRTDNPIPTKLGSKQLKLIKLFEQKRRLCRKEALEFTLSTFKSLEKRGLIQEIQGNIKALDLKTITPHEPKTLTPSQKKVIQTIQTTTKKGALIHGITGSGKTEVYLQLTRDAVNQGKQVILMAPEIALTPQLIDYFAASFPEQIAILHSRLSQGEREREWWRIQTGAARVIIGSRSAIFAPAKEVGLILIDEEHEWSYKQDKTPYYHTRDVAFKIAKLTETKVVLGSATPSIETCFSAKQGNLEYLTLDERIKNSALPDVEIVDMRAELHKKNFTIFSERLIEKLYETLKRNEQAILFLNRRGHSSAVVCRDCGQACQCIECDVSLTHHRFKNGWEQLICHHCGHHESLPEKCAACGGHAIKSVGTGTQRVEQELLKRFPTARVLRADKDTTGKKDSFQSMYEALKNHEIDILIGTQMVGKGLDLPNVTLVGVVLADVGLHIPDFRAGERAFQLLTQVAGRAGRANKEGYVIIQTYNPEHESIQCAADHDYARFYERELTSRNTQKNPPMSRIIKLTFKHSEQKKCTDEIHRVQALLEPLAGPHEITSAPALIPRKHNTFRWHLFIQGPKPEQVLKLLIQKEALPLGWAIDVDPVVMS